jgi:hypothetical protein
MRLHLANGWEGWYMPVISATQKITNKKIVVQANPSIKGNYLNTPHAHRLAELIFLN